MRELVIRRGLVFDGTGAKGVIADVAIRDGRVAEVSEAPLSLHPGADVIDADGKWVMPGFIDVHTHYDAEVLVAPGLTESARHGVTTVLFGSCSLSTVYGTPLDSADMFSRVEALPRPYVLDALERHKTWRSPAEYIDAIERLPLGINVASFIGHSDVRASVMGLGRATDPDVTPSTEELEAITKKVEEALDAGFLGLSTMTNPWDKLDGDRFLSRSLPSTYARWSEHRRLNRVLRARDRVLQSIPNLNTKYDIAFFVAASTGLFRKPLKVSLLAAADGKADAWIHRIFGPLSRVANDLGRGAFRWQHLPTEFQVYADGIELVVFEEFGAGRAALHLRNEVERNALLAQESYRRAFRADFEKRFTSRVWHRDFDDAEIVGCPDALLVGRTIGAVAAERKLHPVDVFLDLVVAYGSKLRWRTTIANHRPEKLDWLINQPGVTVGFSDAGAHLRNMAFYNCGVHLLARVHKAEQRGAPFLAKETAVHKLTGELADFYGLDAGRLAAGERADIVVIDPSGLEGDTRAYAEAPMAELGGVRRMVNRNDAAVAATIVAGRIIYRYGEFVPGLGKDFGPGRFLRAGEPRGTLKAERAAAQALAVA